MVSFKVNGKKRSFSGDPEMPLLWYLRDEAGLTGTKFGCGTGQCGACTVHVNGEAVRSCQTSVADLSGAKVTTIEGLSEKGDHPVQKAWADNDVPQCGYCQAGQIMQAAALLQNDPGISDAALEEGLYGNICRCGTYHRIRKALRDAKGAMS